MKLIHCFVCSVLIICALSCSYGCSQCLTNSTQCAVACNSGWFNNSAGECEVCVLHCSVCTNNNTCDQCKSGFKRNNGGGCDYEESHLALILGLSLGLGIPVFICICYCLLYIICGIYEHYYQDNQQEENREPELCQGESHDGSISQVQKKEHEKLVKEQGKVGRHWIKGKSDSQMDYMMQCSICLQSGVLFRTRCGHSFHTHCFLEWLEKDSKCPNCRESDPYPFEIYCKRCMRSYSQFRPNQLYILEHISEICNDCLSKQGYELHQQ